MTIYRHTLLVVDDDPDLCNQVYRVFEDCCDVYEASNGTEAIQHALKYTPDCILLELALPEMGGFVVCEVLKQIRQTQLIPIIALSDKADDVSRGLAAEAGAIGFLVKPFQRQELRRHVLDTISDHSRERRRCPRLVMSVPLRIEGVSPGREFRIHTLTEDISAKGLRFYGEFEAQVGDTIRIHMLSPSTDPTFAGDLKIVWIDARYSPLVRCGAEFLGVSSAWLIKNS